MFFYFTSFQTKIQNLTGRSKNTLSVNQDQFTRCCNIELQNRLYLRRKKAFWYTLSVISNQDYKASRL